VIEPLLLDEPCTGDVWIGVSVVGVVACEDEDADDESSSELVDVFDVFDVFDVDEFCVDVFAVDGFDVEAEALCVAGWAAAARYAKRPVRPTDPAATHRVRNETRRSPLVRVLVEAWFR
jgi:hypothetical protein